MPKLEYNLRYVSIIKRLRKSEATFDKISEFLERESEFHGYDFNISKRTFQRDLDDIREFLHVDIKYSFSRKVYYITEDTREEENNRMLEAFDLFNTLNKTESFSDYVFFEKRKPQGTEHFYGLLHAVKNRFVVRFVYKKFDDDDVSTRTVEPLGLKEFKGRWYLIAIDRKDNRPKSFGLDRMEQLEILKARFKAEKAFSINEWFKNSFGVVNPSDESPQKVVLSLTPFQAKYVKSYKLHSTQNVILENEDEVRIELFLHPTFDFVMEILSLGAEVKVISPASLKKEVINKLKNALKRYD